MTTQSIKTQAADISLSVQAGKKSLQKQKNASDDFSSVMDNNLKTKSSTTKDNNASTKETKAVNQPSDSTSQNTENTKAVDNKDTGETPVKPTDETQVDNTQNPTLEDDKDDTVTTLVSEELNAILAGNTDLSTVADKLQNLSDSLKKTVKDTLGISDEDLESAMQTLGLTMVDLLNPNNLKQLVLQVNGTDDITALLTDENLANSLQDLIQSINDLKASQDMPLSQEELTNLVNQMQKDADLNAAVNEPVKTTDENTTGTLTDNQKEITVEVVKTSDTELPKNDSEKSNSGSNEPDMQQTTPVDNFIQNLALKGNENSLSFADQVANVRQMQDIVNQVVEQVKVIIKPEQTSMEIQLNPESLGKVNLSVVAKDGIMTAQITTQNELAKQAIESQMHVLKENLNNQGLKVESIEVTVSNFDFNGNSQAAGEEAKGNKNQSQNRRFDTVDVDTYINPDEEDSLESTINTSGSSIDYTA